MILDTIFTLLAALLLAGPLGVEAQSSAFRMDITSQLMNSMMDPIVSPNQVSSHMHKVIGGSRFRSAYNYDDLLSSQCTSVAFQPDKSAYWMPTMYAYDNTTKTYTSLWANIRFYYFLPRISGSNNTDPIPFPKGLRILIGNPMNKSPVSYAQFYCQTNPQFTGNIQGPNFNFDRSCNNGIKIDLNFPGCWNGRDLYKSDGSHMSFTTRGNRDGPCPISHPIRVPTLNLEYTYQANRALGQDVNLKGKLMWANGDTTGYGIHGDFINGWDQKILQQLIDDPFCGNSGGAVGLADCKNFAQYWQPDTAKNCKPEFGILESSIPAETQDMVPLKAIPGCNPPWTDGPKPNSPCSGATYDLNSGLQGWDGPLVADADERGDQTLPTRGGWQDLYCVPDTAIKREYSFQENTLTKSGCQTKCQKSGYSYAAIGQLASKQFFCYCGNSFDQSASRLGMSVCNTPCPGDNSQLCGGGPYQFVLTYAPPGTPLPEDPLQPDGSRYVGCYAEPSSGKASLATIATYRETIYDNTQSVTACKAQCARLGNKWAALKNSNVCYCGQDFNYGAGGFQADSLCYKPCTGNASEICGGPYAASLYNITGLNPTLGSVKRLNGYQGCYTQKSGTQVLNKATWTNDKITPQSCVDGCSELGYKLAGLQANVCSCGDTNSAAKLADSACSTSCRGDKSQICGGTDAIDIYSVSKASNGTTADDISQGKSIPNYLGCYVDSSTSAAMKSPYTVVGNQINAVTCRTACAQYGYKFAGTTVGNTCKCSNTAPATERVVPSRYCTTACKGNSTETCGGTGYMDAFDISSYVSADPNAYKPAGWQGCYTSSANSPTLEKIAYQSSPLSSVTCRTACANQGYQYAGTGNSNTCYCGNSLDKGTKAAMTSCNGPCAGNTNETCGAGTNFIDAYAVSGTGSFNGAVGYAGCFTDDNTLSSFQASLGYNSIDICSAQCAGRGFNMVGVRGNLCKCGTKAPSNNIASSGCNVACSGDSKQTCGGSSSISVYDLSKSGKTTDIKNLKWDSKTGYGGCFYEGSGRMLKDDNTYMSGLTVAKCIEYCGRGGYALAGAEYGTECYCGNKLTWGDGYQLRDTQCSMKCAGGGDLLCGASYSFSLYAVDPKKLGIDAPVPSASASSASSASSTSRAASASSAPAASSTSKASTGAASAASSSTTSRASTASAAAPSSSTTSRASSASTASTTSRASSSSTPPRNDGPSESDAVISQTSTTSSTSTATTTTSSAPAETTTAGFTAGCYATDASFNKMRISSTVMTQNLCADWCGLQGFAYTALFNGNTCQCGSDSYLLKPLASTSCSSACSGSGRSICGGPQAIYVRESTPKMNQCKRDLYEDQQSTFQLDQEIEGSVLLPNERDVRYPRRGAQNKRPRGHSLRRFW